MVAIIAKKDAEIEQRIDDNLKAHTATDEEVNVALDEVFGGKVGYHVNEEVLALQKRVKELEEENSTLREKYQLKEKELEKLKGISEDFLTTTIDTDQNLTLHQKIVFFVTVTSVMLDKRYTHLGNFASFIAVMCDEKQEVIAPKLSRIAHIEKHPGLKKTLHLAAQSVSDLLANTLTDATKNDRKQVINKIRENLMLTFPSTEDE